MAIPFLNNINLSDNELQNAKLHITGTAPTAAAGQIYFDSSDNLAKYYSNGTDTWVSLKDYSFSNGTFVNLSTSGTTAKPIITAELSATGTPSASTYLRGDNTWSPISSISGTTYDLSLGSIAGNYAIFLTGSDSSSDAITLSAGNNITISSPSVNTIEISASNPDQTVTLIGEVTGAGTTSITTTVADGVLDVANFNASAIVTEAEGIENNDNDTTLPTSAAVKAYVDASTVGGLVYQGGYNAATNTPDLTTSPNSIQKGWTYTVTADGTFFGEQLRSGDVLIAEIDSPLALVDWTTVQNNIDLASASQIGIGNVAASTDVALDGLSVTYSNGTGTIGLDINSLSENTSINSSDFIPIRVVSPSARNRKITFDNLVTAISNSTSYARTISDTATITHGLLSKDVIVQLYDIATGETVYADIERTSTTEVTVTFSTTPTNDVRVLVQKIG